MDLVEALWKINLVACWMHSFLFRHTQTLTFGSIRSEGCMVTIGLPTVTFQASHSIGAADHHYADNRHNPWCSKEAIFFMEKLLQTSEAIGAWMSSFGLMVMLSLLMLIPCLYAIVFWRTFSLPQSMTWSFKWLMISHAAVSAAHALTTTISAVLSATAFPFILP